MGGAAIWVTGASSGIGAAFVEAVPFESARVIGVSRRAGPGAENLRIDLADPAEWAAVEASFAEVLSAGLIEEAHFFHCAGSVEAIGPVAGTDAAAYSRAVLVNSAAGQVLGRAFLAAATGAGVPATVVMCSSPSASAAHPGLSHYCAGKAALEQWVRSIAAEVGDGPGAPRVFSVAPRGVRTPMITTAMEQSGEALPLADRFRELDASDGFVSPERAAAQIWQGIRDGVPQGAVLPVGAVAPTDTTTEQE